MSIQAVGWALDQDLPARPKLVLVSIANHANSTDGYCWLKAETIAAEAACTPRSVFRFIGGLIRNGYLRKAPKRGADGKQRANDYWLLLNRAPAIWDWGAGLHEDDDAELPEDLAETDDTSDAETHGIEDADLQDVGPSPDVDKHVLSHGPHDSSVTRSAENTHAESVGPCDSRVSHKGIAEPSKTNPKIDARARGATPRSYRGPSPDPPQPLGAVVEHQPAQIFVYYPSKAYAAWALVKERERKAAGDYRKFTVTTNRNGRTGWYFPSLFPPPSSGEQDSDGSDGESIDPPFQKSNAG